MTQDAHLRLMLAVAFSGALHCALIYGVTVRTPPRESESVIAARLLTDEVTAPDHQSRAPVPERASVPQRLPETVGERAPRPRSAPLAQAVRAERPASRPLPSVEMPLLQDPTWYSADQLDVYPRAIDVVQPVYPMGAAGARGEVSVLLMVDEQGRVHRATVLADDSQGLFDDAALAALRTARFEPARKDGHSVRSRILVRVVFAPDEPVDEEANNNLSPRRHEVDLN